MEFDRGDTIKFKTYPGAKLFKGIVRDVKSCDEDEFGRKSMIREIFYEVISIKPEYEHVYFVSMWQTDLTKLVLTEKWKKNLE